MSDPQPIDIEEAEVQRLIDQAQQGQLDAADQKRIVPLLRTLLWLQRTLLETRISLAKLRKILFGKCTEKAPRKPEPPPDGAADSPGGSDDTSDSPSDPPGVERKEGTSTSRHHDRGMVAAGRRIIPAPRRVFVPTIRSKRARLAPPASAGGSTSNSTVTSLTGPFS